MVYIRNRHLECIWVTKNYIHHLPRDLPSTRSLLFAHPKSRCARSTFYSSPSFPALHKPWSYGKPTLLAYFNLLSLTLLYASANDFACPEDDIAATGCKGPKDCLYPDPDSCEKFIRCELNADGVTGRPVERDCPTGLQWNDNKKECGDPEESTCPKSALVVQAGEL